MRRRMSKAVDEAPAAAPTNGHVGRGVFLLSDWKCVNWHNLLTLPGPATGPELTRIKGDVFNLGPNESGKSTWLDGLHAALTMGKPPYMEWNSASDPSTSAQKLREKGRNLNGIIFRVGLQGAARTQPVIVYFAFEATNPATREVYSIGVGAWATGLKADPECWGFIIPKPLVEVHLKDEAHVFDRAELEQRYGKDKVHSLPRFRQRMADLFYGGRLENYDQALQLLNLSKSYPRLAEKSAKFSDLFRRVLPAPDASHVAEARQDIATIQELEHRINEAQELANDLGKILDVVENVRRNRVALRRYAYRQALDAHRSAAANVKRLKLKLAEAEGKHAQATAARQEAGAAADLKKSLLIKLASQEDQMLVQRAQEAEMELGKAVERLTQAKEALDKAKGRQTQAAGRVDAAWEQLSAAANGLAQQLQALTKTPEAARHPECIPRLMSCIDALGKMTPSDGAPAADFETAQANFLEAMETARRQAEAAQLQAKLAVDAAGDRLTEARKQRDLLAAQADLPPVGYEGLDEALRGIQDLVTVCYRALEFKSGREGDAALLETYLPGQILASVLPRNPDDHDRIRAHLRRRMRRVKVIDVQSVVPATELSDEALLACLAPTEPRILQWLAGSYGNVVVLPKDAERGMRPRVVWRSGDVYDGHAWHLETDSDKPRFIGSAARQQAKARRLAEFAEQIIGLENQFAALQTRHNGETANVNAARVVKQRFVQAVNAAVLQQLIRALQKGQEGLATAVALLAREDSLHTNVRIEHGIRQELVMEIQAELRRTGAGERQKHYAEVVAQEKMASKHLNECSDAEGASRTVVEETNKQTAAAVEAETAASSVLAEKRTDLFQFAEAERFDDSTFEKYLTDKQVFVIKAANLQEYIDGAHDALGSARTEIGQLLVRVSPRKALHYDEESNAVTHLDVPLATEYERLKANLAADRIKHANELSESAKKVFVLGIAAGLKAEDARMHERVDRINEILGKVDFRGVTFEVVPTPVKARDGNSDAEKQEFQDRAQMRKLVLDTDESTDPEPIGRFMIERFRSLPSVRDDEVPTVFDYRHWYEFQLKRNEKSLVAPVSLAGDDDLPDILTNASGGGKQIPRYLFCFALFKLLYDSIGARLRLVLLDEAFETVDPKNIDALLSSTKVMGLNLVVNNPKLRATEAMGENTTYMFSKDEQEQTWIQPWRSQPKEATV